MVDDLAAGGEGGDQGQAAQQLIVTARASKATPTGILITPPDEKDSLKVDWTGGAVPVSSAANLTAFQAGTGA